MARSTHAEAAAQIRKHLKTNNIKAHVRCRGGRGSSINVTVYDQPPAAINKIESFCGQYEHGHFDGMTDCYEFSNRRDDLPQVYYVFVTNEYSAELRQAAWDWARNRYADLEGAPESASDAHKHWMGNGSASEVLYRILRGTEQICEGDSFWSTQKPRKRLQAAMQIRPVSVFVHWSESELIDDETTWDYDVFERVARTAAMSHTTGGYLKTKYTVTLSDGSEHSGRLDLAVNDMHGIKHCMDMSYNYAMQHPDREAGFIELYNQVAF